jgi:hypothetical protein
MFGSCLSIKMNSGFVFAQGLMFFQAEGAPPAIKLIAIFQSFPEAVRVSFRSLNTSNQDLDIQKILFIRIRSNYCIIKEKTPCQIASR